MVRHRTNPFDHCATSAGVTLGTKKLVVGPTHLLKVNTLPEQQGDLNLPTWVSVTDKVLTLLAWLHVWDKAVSQAVNKTNWDMRRML